MSQIEMDMSPFMPSSRLFFYPAGRQAALQDVYKRQVFSAPDVFEQYPGSGRIAGDYPGVFLIGGLCVFEIKVPGEEFPVHTDPVLLLNTGDINSAADFYD